MTDHKGTWKTTRMRIGAQMQVRAYKSDGTCYRWWYATVESVEKDEFVLVTPTGHWIDGIDGGMTSENALRVHYWADRWYCLLEAYTPEGELAEIYVNINSPIEIEDLQVCFTDYELDVIRRPPGEARLEDEDEFQEAAAEYGYSEAFQRACYLVAAVAMDLANGWVGRGLPQCP